MWLKMFTYPLTCTYATSVVVCSLEEFKKATRLEESVRGEHRTEYETFFVNMFIALLQVPALHISHLRMADAQGGEQ
jgi:hypothetical protein